MSSLAAKDIPDTAVLMVVAAVHDYGWEFLSADRVYWPASERDADMPEYGWLPDHFPHCYLGKVQYSTWVKYETYTHGGPPDGGIGASRWTLEEELWEFPPKVVLAKLKRLIHRKLIDGCACGCRGDFTITDEGRALLTA